MTMDGGTSTPLCRGAVIGLRGESREDAIRAHLATEDRIRGQSSMSQTITQTLVAVDAAEFEKRIRRQIESLAYLPTAVAVAMKFMELGSNLDAEPGDYAKIIGADSSLSAKLLALANSPYFGVRNRVTTVRNAVNLLGLGTIRTIAISYCMAGLHNDLRLTRTESRRFWEASLCKAVAARCYAAKLEPSLADEAFVAGLFEDFAAPVIYAVAREPYMAILTNRSISARDQLEEERNMLGLDHTEVGRILAQKLNLPEIFVDSVAFHHNSERLNELLLHKVTAQAVQVSALFPHLLEAWNQEDADELCRGIDSGPLAGKLTSAEFLQEVQASVDEYYHYFDQGGGMETRLADLLIQTAREGADHTEHLVRTVHQMMQDTASMGFEMSQLIRSNSQLMDKATRDQLTGLLNREGFSSAADRLLDQSARYSTGFALAFFDIDHFKRYNDVYGHQFGDRVLTSIAACLKEGIREQDLAARMGGDEFTLLLGDCEESDARGRLERILARAAATFVGRADDKVRPTLSAGLVCVRPSDTRHSLHTLIERADQLMYQSKQAGGNRMHYGTI
jgi:diguanylate cyclase (GGDEF)-like protein